MSFPSSHARWICTLSVGFTLLAAALYLTHAFYARPAAGNVAAGSTQEGPYVRIGLAPEGDIFKQRKAYLALKEYVEEKLSHGSGSGKVSPKVEIFTASSYAGVLHDLRENKIDAAFVGSLIAVLSADRCDAQVVLKSERTPASGGSSMYTGVIFVREDSPIRKFDDLKNQRLGAVRTTTGGAVFPLFLMTQANMSAGDAPELVWSGTHDDVIREVVDGHLAAGAVKDLRLHNFQREHPDIRLRVIAQSAPVPDNALLFRHNYSAERRDAVLRILRNMHEDPRGAAALAQQNITRYLPCKADEYDDLYKMLDGMGNRWDDLKIEGPAPRRPYVRSMEDD